MSGQRDDAQQAALAIIDWFHKAEDDLLGSTVQTFNGEIGRVREIKLDEHHGLCFTMDKPGYAGPSNSPRFYPVSTIRMKS